MKRDDIVIRSLNSPLSKEDEVILSEWLAESKENRDLYRRMEVLNTAANMLEGYDESARANLAKRMMKDIRRERLLRTSAKLWAAGIAACIAILIMIFVNDDNGSRMIMGNKTSIAANHIDTIFRNGEIVAYVEKVPNETRSVKIDKDIITDTLNSELETKIQKTAAILNVIKVPHKNIYTIYLPDSTMVLIRGGSTLSYPSEFDNDKREVQLDGEAFFDVVKNRKRPFIVKTRDVKSVVYGTKINVEAYPESDYISTTLFSGLVEVNGINLSPGMRAIKYSKDKSITVSDIDLRSIDSWTRNEFYFNDVALEEIIKDLSDWYGMKFIFADEELRKMSFTMICSRDNDLTYIMGMLTKTQKVKFKVTGNGIYVENKL